MNNNTNTAAQSASKLSIRTMVMVAMLGAVAMVLYYFDFPLWFAPSFYKIDFSEVPVMIGTFALGPAAGAAIELVKCLLKLVIKGTDTAFVGDIANFIIGCALIVPAGIVYKMKKTRKGAIVGMVCGTVVLTVVGCLMNAFVLLPAYAKAFGMPIDALVGMGSAVNPAITDIRTFALLAVAPFNLLKGALVSVITFVLYKYVSPILKGNHM